MQVALPELDSAATINFHREISVDDFEAFCAENPSLRAELSAHFGSSLEVVGSCHAQSVP